jgi:hypothetical protein
MVALRCIYYNLCQLLLPLQGVHLAVRAVLRIGIPSSIENGVVIDLEEASSPTLMKILATLESTDDSNICQRAVRE